LPGCALGKDPNVLGVTVTNLSTTPVSPLPTGFSKSYFHGGLLALFISTYVSGDTWAFLQPAAAEITPPKP